MARFYPSDRLAILVDGSNFHGALKAIDCAVDYKKLQDYFGKLSMLVEAAYYTRIWNEQDDETKERDFNPLMPLLDYLAYNGWRTVTKRVREVQLPGGGSYKSGDTNVELACDILRLSTLVNVIVLCSGNGDFVYPVRAAQDRGCRVYIVASLEPNTVADQLRREAFGFIDVKFLKEHIQRTEKKNG